MNYTLFLNRGGETEWLAHPVSPGSESYLRDVVSPALRPLSDAKKFNSKSSDR
jgi:hypothetical protein